MSSSFILESFKHKKPLRCHGCSVLVGLCGLVLTASVVQPAGKNAVGSPEGPLARASKGQTYYTQFSLFHEGFSHRTTNYRKGILVSVNTEVTFLKAGKKDIQVRLLDGGTLRIVNIPEFSGENINGIFARTFSTNKVDLSVFTQEERNAILSGSVEPGMSKASVVVALGYPPKHRTASLYSNQWRYWQNRFNTFVVHFADDKVTHVQQ